MNRTLGRIICYGIGIAIGFQSCIIDTNPTDNTGETEEEVLDLTEDEMDEVFTFGKCVLTYPPKFPECEEVKMYDDQVTCFQNQLNAFIKEHHIYPEEAKKKGIEGKVYVQFEIDSTGTVQHIEAIRGDHEVLVVSALQVVKQLPKLKPPMYQGKPSSMKYTIPLKYKLKDKISVNKVKE